MTKRTDPAVERNLDFIHRILYAKGYNMASFAKAVGISQQLAYHYFTVRDDMTLYNAQTLLGKLGIEIQPGFIAAERPEQEPQTDSVLTIKQTENYILQGEEILYQRTEAPRYIKEHIGKGKRLDFLAKELASLQIDEKGLCQKLELKRGMLIYIFEKDDIKISTLYGIAKKLGKKITWVIKNVQGEITELTPGELAEKKLRSIVGDDIDIIETIHTKGNKFRFRVSVKEGKAISTVPGVKIVSVGQGGNEVILETFI